MKKKLSFHLDILRGLAAVCVLLHHYNKHFYSGGNQIFPDIGQEAVIVFFVVSGFVIAWVGMEKENNLSEFLVRRLARLWSVLIPAILIILSCFLLAKMASQKAEFVDGNGQHILEKSAAALTFLNWNSFTGGFYLPAGGVTWSLSCEFWYYIMFAVWTFLPNKAPKWIILILLIALLGFKPMLLFPIWVMGAYAYRSLRWNALKAHAPKLVMLGAIATAIILQMSNLRFHLLHVPTRFQNYLGHSYYAPYFWVLGVLIVLYVLAAASLPHQEAAPSTWIERPVRSLAGVSYFLYLTHVPVMSLLAVLLAGHEPFLFFIPLVALVFALLVGGLVENSKRWYAARLRFLFETNALSWLRNYSIPTPQPQKA